MKALTLESHYILISYLYSYAVSPQVHPQPLVSLVAVCFYIQQQTYICLKSVPLAQSWVSFERRYGRMGLPGAASSKEPTW